ncbi:MAG: hypothetical protein AAF384_14915 [Pseudomonadota bacterium]
MQASRSPFSLGALLLFVLSLGVANAQMPAMSFDAVLKTLEIAGPGHRTMFAAAAARVVREEFVAVRDRQARDITTDASWLGAMDDYIQSLAEIERLAQFGEPVIILDEVPAVRVVVGDQQFAISGPQPGQQAVIERSVVRAFCQTNGCGDPPLESLAGLPLRVAIAETGDATEHPNQNGDGLSCSTELRHRTLFVKACAALLADLRAVSKLLVTQRAVSWQDKMHSPGRLLLKRESGDVWRLTVDEQPYGDAFTPLMMGGAPEIFEAAQGWLKARLRGTYEEHVLSIPPRLVYRAYRAP